MLGVFGEVVRDTEDCLITDYQLEGVTLSVTELREGKATRGHSHKDAECYFFQTDAVVRLGHKTYEVKTGQMLLVRPGDFHRVYAPPGRTARFVCFFSGSRAEKQATYSTG
jgi:quercetin dioxygenase-like cupin family protein